MISKLVKRHKKAEESLHDACNDGFKLHASIPANVKEDHDILIGSSLNDLAKLIPIVDQAIKHAKHLGKHHPLVDAIEGFKFNDE